MTLRVPAVLVAFALGAIAALIGPIVEVVLVEAGVFRYAGE